LRVPAAKRGLSDDRPHAPARDAKEYAPARTRETLVVDDEQARKSRLLLRDEWSGL
jgi:hypothetical protein